MNLGKAYSVLRCAERVEEYPFPHIVIENALPYWLYDALCSTRPELKAKGSNKGYVWNAKHALSQNLSDVWTNFIKYHCSAEFYKEVVSLFLMEYEWPIGSVGMRYRDNADIRLDCQISINTPAEEEGQVCIAHVDNPETKWAGLLYMPDIDDNAGGDLELYDCPKPEYFGKRRVANPGKAVKVVPYKRNTFVCFLNTPTSVHAPQPRKVTTITRKFVNFVIDI